MKEHGMRKLVSNTFVTLDGVMQAPGGPEEDPSGGFRHGGWAGPPYWDEKMGKNMDEFVSKPFDLLLGRKTYEIFAAYWPFAEDDPENSSMAKKLNGATKYVASKTLDKADWPTSHIIRDVAKDVAQLKQGDGPPIQVHGSADLLQTLIKHDLIDEYRVWTFPVVVGPGKRLFGDGAHGAGLTAVGTETSSTGVVFTTYRPAGEIKYGTFATEEPSQEEVDRREKMAAEA
jgi:dihydrofolate reductase